MKKEEAQIEQLMIEKLTGMISGEDNDYLEKLIRGDEDVLRQWEEVKENFDKSKPHQYLEKINTDTAWQQVYKGIENKKTKRVIYRRKWAVAASLVIPLLLAGSFYLHTYTKKKSPFISHIEQSKNSVKLLVQGIDPINLSHYNRAKTSSSLSNINLQVNNGSLSYVTLNDQTSQDINVLKVPQTQTYRITLSDGTEVSLNSMSQLKFPFTFSSEKREVWLSGEAYFIVAKDEKRPFVVHTSLTDIKVLGTEFNVNTYDSTHITTSLVQGAVSAEVKGGKGILLKPGYEAVFSTAGGFDVKTFDQQSVLSWMRGIYYFQNASLKEIATVIHRWYGDSIHFEDSKTASNRFTGALLKNKPLTEFLDNLALTSNIQYVNKDGVIDISMK